MRTSLGQAKINAYRSVHLFSAALFVCALVGKPLHATPAQRLEKSSESSNAPTWMAPNGSLSGAFLLPGLSRNLLLWGYGGAESALNRPFVLASGWLGVEGEYNLGSIKIFGSLNGAPMWRAASDQRYRGGQVALGAKFFNWIQCRAAYNCQYKLFNKNAKEETSLSPLKFSEFLAHGWLLERFKIYGLGLWGHCSGLSKESWALPKQLGLGMQWIRGLDISAICYLQDSLSALVNKSAYGLKVNLVAACGISRKGLRMIAPPADLAFKHALGLPILEKSASAQIGEIETAPPLFEASESADEAEHLYAKDLFSEETQSTADEDFFESGTRESVSFDESDVAEHGREESASETKAISTPTTGRTHFSNSSATKRASKTPGLDPAQPKQAKSSALIPSASSLAMALPTTCSQPAESLRLSCNPARLRLSPQATPIAQSPIHTRVQNWDGQSDAANWHAYTLPREMDRESNSCALRYNSDDAHLQRMFPSGIGSYPQNSPRSSELLANPRHGVANAGGSTAISSFEIGRSSANEMPHSMQLSPLAPHAQKQLRVGPIDAPQVRTLSIASSNCMGHQNERFRPLSHISEEGSHQTSAFEERISRDASIAASQQVGFNEGLSPSKARISPTYPNSTQGPRMLSIRKQARVPEERFQSKEMRAQQARPAKLHDKRGKKPRKPSEGSIYEQKKGWLACLCTP